MITYPSFTTPNVLLDMLIARFYQRRPAKLPYDEIKIWKNEVLLPIRKRVLKIVQLWVDYCWKDFTDELLFSRFSQFVQNDMAIFPASKDLIECLQHNVGVTFVLLTRSAALWTERQVTTN